MVVTADDMWSWVLCFRNSLALGLYRDILWSKGVYTDQQQEKSPHEVHTLVVVADDSSETERLMNDAAHSKQQHEKVVFLNELSLGLHIVSYYRNYNDINKMPIPGSSNIGSLGSWLTIPKSRIAYCAFKGVFTYSYRQIQYSQPFRKRFLE